MTLEEFNIAKSLAKFIPDPEYDKDEDNEKDEFICIEFLGFKVGEIVLITEEILVRLGVDSVYFESEFKIMEIDCDETELDREWFFYVKAMKKDFSNCFWVAGHQMQHLKLYSATNSDEAKSEIKMLIGKVSSNRGTL